MATSTRFTDLVGCEMPLQLAPMGGVGTTELSSAVADAGGCGMVPWGSEPGEGVTGVNFLMPFQPTMEEIVEAAKSSRLVDFFYGDPRSDVVEGAHGGGALVGWQVGSVPEALAAEECGCDYVVAQGIEAGGHVRGTDPLDDLLPAVRSALGLPVLAAGGVSTAERFAELIEAGADGVRVGTRFVTSPESGAHPDYRRELHAAGPDDTELTRMVWRGLGGGATSGASLGARRSSEKRLASTGPPIQVGRSRADRHGDVRRDLGVGEITSARAGPGRSRRPHPAALDSSSARGRLFWIRQRAMHERPNSRFHAKQRWGSNSSQFSRSS